MIGMEKRGALELSINTIVVIVIGVTLLTLGLTYVYNTFKDIEGQRKSINEALTSQIRETFGKSDDPLNLLTTSIAVKQKEYDDLGIGIRNTVEDGKVHTFSYNVIFESVPPGINEDDALKFIDWTITTFKLKSGELFADNIGIDPSSNIPLGNYRARVILTCSDCVEKDIQEKTFTIRVRPE